MTRMQNHKQNQQGLVISYFGNRVSVMVEGGNQVVQCHLRRNQSLPVVGDYVQFEYEQTSNQQTGVITNILPRLSLLEKYDGRPGKMKPIAANIDMILIVMAPPPILAEYLIDRYLIASELLAIKAAVVLNKIDLIADQTALTTIESRLQPYRVLDYPVIFSSIYQQNGLDELRKFLQDKTAVLVGPSGVGKSSIIARLSGLHHIETRDVSPKGAGKHTTTATRLYSLENGGRLIDSPGVREFNLWPISVEELQRGFKELLQYKGQCKFRDCQHLAEPSCAVQAAVVDGKISAERLANYHELWKKTKQRK